MLHILLEQYQRATSLAQRLSILQEITAYVMQTGPRGGRFYYTPKGRKVYRVFKGRKRGTGVGSAWELEATWEAEAEAADAAPFAHNHISVSGYDRSERKVNVKKIANIAKAIFGDKHTQFTPKLLKKMFSAPGLTASNMEVSADHWDSSINVRMDLKNSKGEVIGRQERAFRKMPGGLSGESYVYHALFTLKDQYQGGGRAGTLFAEALKGYQKLGASKIDVSAGLTAGPYTWARFGFNTKSPGELNHKKEAFKTFASDRLGIPEKSLTKLLARTKNMRELSGLKMTRTVKDPDTGEKKKVTIPLGKQFLLYSNSGSPSGWGGTVDLKDPKQVSTFKSQCKKGQKQRTAAISAGKADEAISDSAQEEVFQTRSHWSREFRKEIEDPKTKQKKPMKFTPQQWYESNKKLKDQLKAEEKRRKEEKERAERAKARAAGVAIGGTDPTGRTPGVRIT